MKHLFFALTLTATVIKCAFAVSYQTMEYKPKGKNYSLINSSAVYGYSPDASGTETVWIMCDKRKGNGFYITAIMASKQLEQKLPLLVLRYIGNNVVAPRLKETKSADDIKTLVKNAVDRALDQQYKNKLLTEGAKMAQDSSYFRGHFNENWWMPNYYYDYEISFSKDTAKAKSFLTNSVNDKSFPSLGYVTDQLKKFGYHHDVKDLAKWPDNVMSCCGTERDNYKFVVSPIQDDQDFHLRSDSCRFTLKKTSISHGKKYTRFAAVSIFGWYATYCNFFASDLQNKIFGKPLWSTKGCPLDYAYLTGNDDFIVIAKEEIKKYSAMGYFVFMIDKGHVTTAYPNSTSKDFSVVQAGSETGIYDISSIWSKFYKRTDIIAYVYLGHLKN